MSDQAENHRNPCGYFGVPNGTPEQVADSWVPTDPDRCRIHKHVNDKGPVIDPMRRLAEHLADQLIPGGRCELTKMPDEPDEREAYREDHGRCRGRQTAIRWEDGFADKVCDRHAAEAEKRGVIVVRPRRHDGTNVILPTSDGGDSRG